MSKICEGLNCTKVATARGHCPAHLYRFYRYGDFEKTKKSPWHESRKLFDELSLIETDDCVVWTGTQGGQGYGVLYVDRKVVRVHRLALQNRTPERDMSKFMALHKSLVCHNRACMNYRHLYWGTAKDNSKDAKIDGTAMLGERNHRARLKHEDVDNIRSEYASGRYTQSEISMKYGVTSNQISKIVNRKAWKYNNQ